MNRHGWALDMLSAVAAVVSGYYGAVVMRDIILSSLDIFQQGSGGLGAVSVGISESLLVWIPSVLLNRLLARPARQLGGLVRTLHRAHTASFVAALILLVLAALTLGLSVVPTNAVIGGFFLLGFLFALQFLLLAATLLAFVWQRHKKR